METAFLELLELAGAAPPRFGRGKWRCPHCPERATPALSVNLERGLFHCHRCGWSGGRRSLERELGIQSRKASRAELKQRRAVREQAQRFAEWVRVRRINTAALLRELDGYERQWREEGQRQLAAGEPVGEVVFEKLSEIVAWIERAEALYSVLCDPEAHVNELLREYRAQRRVEAAAA